MRGEPEEDEARDAGALQGARVREALPAHVTSSSQDGLAIEGASFFKRRNSTTWRTAIRNADGMQCARGGLRIELVRQQRKMAIIRRAMAQRRLPRLSSIEKHGLSDEELRASSTL